MNWNRSIIRWLAVAAVMLSLSAASFAQVFVSVRIGPPPLPVYAQPICPGPGYFWTPGYWAWDDDGGYYWVPGTWVVAPVGMLWTPGYWGWGGGFYLWHPGYWGPHIGFYGGINYGFGYTGVGFFGGEWRGRNFYYNRSVTNVSVTNVTNVYNKTVIVNNTTVNNVSYNGGTGGVKREPTPLERQYEHEQHMQPIAAQTQHQQMAVQNRQNFAAENHGRPAIAATARPADFSSRSVIAARAAGGEYHAPAMSPKQARGPAVPANRPFTPANSNNANRTTGNSTPSPQDKTNGGFRPFTPPNKSAGNSSASGAQGKSNGGYRPFNPPNSNQPQPRGNNPAYHPNGNGGNNPSYEPRSRAPQATPPSSHPSQTAPPPRHESAPPAPPQPRHESAPPQPRHESAPPRQQPNPPREEHKQPGKGR